MVFSPYGSKDNLELCALKKEKVSLVSLNSSDIFTNINKLVEDQVLSKKLSENALKKMKINGTKKLALKVLSLIHK